MKYAIWTATNRYSVYCEGEEKINLKKRLMPILPLFRGQGVK